MAKKWLGSEVGMVLKTATIPTSATSVTENGRKIVKSGTLIEDAVLGKGLLYNDVDVTEGARVASIMIAGFYIDANLPASVSASATELAARGLHAVNYGSERVSFGEVNL